MIYDVAAKYDSGFSLASAVIIPFLQDQGIQAIDKVILSHDDNDHAGGIGVLQSEYQITEIMGVTDGYTACQYPKQWQWDQVQFEIYSPLELIPYLANNSSCVLKVSSMYGSILLTGDIEEPVEYRLINKFPTQIKSDVLLIPHHGSKTSSSLSFIQQVNPKVAINSSGFMNQFNHPHPKIKQQYINQNIEFYDTQDKGMIEVEFSNKPITVTQHANNYPHFWDVSLKQANRVQ
jgi:competence protein ComEC